VVLVNLEVIDKLRLGLPLSISMPAAFGVASGGFYGCILPSRGASA
jgi:hypothetical protein